MALLLEELLCHLPEHDRASYLRLPKANQEELRYWISNSQRLPRTAADLVAAPGTVSGPALHRTRVCDRGFVELMPFDG